MDLDKAPLPGNLRERLLNGSLLILLAALLILAATFG